MDNGYLLQRNITHTVCKPFGINSLRLQDLQLFICDGHCCCLDTRHTGQGKEDVSEQIMDRLWCGAEAVTGVKGASYLSTEGCLLASAHYKMQIPPALTLPSLIQRLESMQQLDAKPIHINQELIVVPFAICKSLLCSDSERSNSFIHSSSPTASSSISPTSTTLHRLATAALTVFPVP